MTMHAESGNAVLDHVVASVQGRMPVDERERSAMAAFVEHVSQLRARGADPLDQDDDPVHITGSGVVVGTRGVVLLKHKRLGLWLQPGGHVDPGESPWAAAKRETVEETGLAVEFIDPGSGAVLPVDDTSPPLLHVDVHAGGRGHTHLDVRYLLGGCDDDPEPPAGESQEVEWFEWDAALERADPGLSGLLIAIRELVRRW